MSITSIDNNFYFLYFHNMPENEKDNGILKLQCYRDIYLFSYCPLLWEHEQNKGAETGSTYTEKE